MNNLKVSECPNEIKVAFDHIREYHPVTTAFYDSNATWLYSTADGKVPEFHDEVHIGVLQNAMDAADNAGLLPCKISL